MNQFDVVIVGGGLFGQIIGEELRSQGREVTIYDAGKMGAGSIPAACLMKPSWYSGLGDEITRPALALLESHYDVQELPFSLGIGTVKVKWVNPRHILGPTVEAEVTYVDEHGWFELSEPSDGKCRAELLIVAAGVWSDRLAPVPGLRAQAGIAFTWFTPSCFQMTGRIKAWAPYRQLVAFKRDEQELWASDGTSIKAENWTMNHETQARARVTEWLQLRQPSRQLYGLRPYVHGARPCYLSQRGRMWIATGGAKNGTIAAAWCAHRIGGHA